VFAGIALLLLNPLEFWMPTMMHITLLALGVGAFGVFALLILREGQGDEREDIHRMRAGRTAFLTGSSILLTATIIQSFAHAVDPWVVAALLGMVLAKAGTRIWSGLYR
jgi:hypothetical protein